MAAQAGINQHPSSAQPLLFCRQQNKTTFSCFPRQTAACCLEFRMELKYKIFIHLSLSSVRLVLADSQFKVSCNSPRTKDIIRSHPTFLQKEYFQYLSFELFEMLDAQYRLKDGWVKEEEDTTGGRDTSI